MLPNLYNNTLPLPSFLHLPSPSSALSSLLFPHNLLSLTLLPLSSLLFHGKKSIINITLEKFKTFYGKYLISLSLLAHPSHIYLLTHTFVLGVLQFPTPYIIYSLIVISPHPSFNLHPKSVTS